MKLQTHRKTVFLNAVWNVGLVRIVTKLAKGSFRKCQSVLPMPFKSVNPMIAVYSVGYAEKIRYAIVNGRVKR